MRPSALALLLCLAPACNEDETLGLVRFNNPADTLTVQVTAAGDVGEPIETNLRSNTGSVIVGMATIDPGSGPVGTDHQVQVWVEPDYQDRVIRSRVVATGERGEQIHPMQRDSAEPRLWQLQLRSYGSEGEVRSDTFAIELWRAADPTEEPDREDDEE